MATLAELERTAAWRALRERRNHFHIYAFAGGERPAEPLVASLLDDVEAANPGGLPRRPRAQAGPQAAVGGARPPAARAGPVVRTNASGLNAPERPCAMASKNVSAIRRRPASLGWTWSANSGGSAGWRMNAA